MNTARTSPPSESRDRSIDILKGIGIVFVFIGHMGSPQYGGQSILNYVYTFHMPLFFLVMGYLAIRAHTYSFRGYAWKKVKSLLVPYVAFFVFSVLWTQIVYALATGAPVFSFPIGGKGLLTAFFLSGGYAEAIPLNNFPLWFLPLAFIASLGLYGLVKYLRSTKWLLIATIVITLLTLPLQDFLTGRPAWHINVLPAALAFMLIGYLYARHEQRLRRLRGAAVGIGFVATGYATSLLCPIGSNIAHVATYVYFLSAILSTYGYFLLARESGSAVLAHLGKYSLHYFSLHALVLLVFPATRVDALLVLLHQDGVVAYIVRLAVAIGLTGGLVAFWRWSGRLVRRQPRTRAVTS
jgi:fucose 4-O-acetylase-like acetyltransferase